MADSIIHTFQRITVGKQLLVALAMGSVAISYAPVFGWAAGKWSSDLDSSHGFLIPIVFLGYCWVHRRALVQMGESPFPVGAIAVGVGLLITSVVLRGAGMYTRVMAMELFSFVMLISGIIALLFGRSGLVRLLPAIAVLMLMIPIPGALIRPVRDALMQTATAISVYGLQTVGVPTFSQGSVIVLPDTQVGVAEACSGLRVLVSLVALVAVVAMFFVKDRTEQFVLFAAILPVALLINSARICLIVLAAFVAPDWQEMVHDMAGLTMIAAAIGMLYVVHQSTQLCLIDPDRNTSQPESSRLAQRNQASSIHGIGL